jgi:hypothetical protein
MKQRAHVHSLTHSVKRAQMQQAQARSNLRWIIISAICASALICLIGIASATSASNKSATQAAKSRTLQRLINAGTAPIGAKTNNSNQALAQPVPIRQAGIANMHQGPFLTRIFTVRNFWQGPVGNDWVLAYSGAKTLSSGYAGLGGIVLYTETSNAHGGFDLHPVGTFLAHDGTTALTITEVDGNLLQLSSENGPTLTFDLVTHQFF